MHLSELVQIAFYFLVLLILVIPLGSFIAKVLNGERHIFSKFFSPLETLIYKMGGINNKEEMSWKSYTSALLIFNLLGFVLLLAMQLLQHSLPFNPEGLSNIPFFLALNTAISFTTNTNWQAYSGEAVMSYFTQMLGLGVQNFLSAATGVAVVAALARGLSRNTTDKIGNFWVDLTRTTVYILLPLSFIFAVFLVSQGVVQTFSSYIDYQTIEGQVGKIPLGPAASQVAIKQLGSNGGGFFGVNSAHPFENPTPLSNFFEMLALLLIPAALPLAFGRMLKNKAHGKTLLATMLGIFMIIFAVALYYESIKNPLTNTAFLEGKETRFGIASSTLWAVATSATSNGSVNSMISSMSPITSGLCLLNIMLGEVIFGGVGSGLYGMALFVILAVFISGLMVGRTPEYLGKKIEAKEVRLAVIGVLAPGIVILTFSAIACISVLGLSSIANPGPHGLSEILYAFSSAAGNNGSALAGLNANTNFYNILTGIAMIIGRFAVIIPVLAISGSLATKKTVPPSLGTFPTEGFLFSILLSCTILIVGALTFFPALTLGPIMEHFLMINLKSF